MGCKASTPVDTSASEAFPKPSIKSDGSTKTYVFDDLTEDLPPGYCIPEIQVVDNGGTLYNFPLPPQPSAHDANDNPSSKRREQTCY
eukprot:CAMPEP_0194044198 /NCGR_PEP_ID=MMETSP0009_2-20130614/15699_1 /TAXON_ID=210454 /ORGANISM="Grammatophora oceanica, Strain CCMP 410" /LENGTH=86 /DNA_ID=CAMNT_0038688647 /DNA_START=103 /DNA_END=363 /DNA_ORIENTATION=-